MDEAHPEARGHPDETGGETQAGSSTGLAPRTMAELWADQDLRARWDEIWDVTDEQREAILAYARDHRDCSFGAACEAAGVRRKDGKALRKSDREFEDDWLSTQGVGPQHLIAGLRKLALEGVKKPIVSAGKIMRDDAGEILYETVYDSRTLLWLADHMTDEGRRVLTAKFGIEISGPDGGPVQLEQKGATLRDALAWALEKGIPLPELVEGEVVAETDEPAP